MGKVGTSFTISKENYDFIKKQAKEQKRSNSNFLNTLLDNIRKA